MRYIILLHKIYITYIHSKKRYFRGRLENIVLETQNTDEKRGYYKGRPENLKNL